MYFGTIKKNDIANGPGVRVNLFVSGCTHHCEDCFNAETWNFSDVGVGVSAAIAGIYVDFVYVSPDHRFDSHVVMSNWDDHSALTINAGYQIPIYQDYVFITPIIGIARVTTGYTEGNNIGVDTESQSIYHKYTATWHRNDFNYGAHLTVVPCK